MIIIYAILFTYTFVLVGLSLLGVLFKSIQEGLGLQEYLIIPALMFIVTSMLLQAIELIL